MFNKKRKFEVNSIEGSTIMPDGRPLYAWENEIQMARVQLDEAKEKLKEAKRLMQLLHIAKIEMNEDIATNDIIVRFSMFDAVKDLHFEDNLAKHYKRV